MGDGDSAGNGPDKENAPPVIRSYSFHARSPRPERRSAVRILASHDSSSNGTPTAAVARVSHYGAGPQTDHLEMTRNPSRPSPVIMLIHFISPRTTSRRDHRFLPSIFPPSETSRQRQRRPENQGNGLTLPSPSSSSKTLLARVPPCLAARSPPSRWDQAAGLAAGRPSRTGPPPSSSRRRGDAEAEAVGKRV